MTSSSAISRRFRRVREHLGQSQTQMAATLGIAQSTLSQLESGHSSPSFEVLCKLAEHCEVDLNWLVSGQGQAPGESNQGARTEPRLNVPLVDVEARAGYLDADGDPDYIETLEAYRIPGFEDDDGLRLFEVDGNSMLPTFCAGDFVVGRRVDPFASTPPNTLAVVVNADGVLLKRITLLGGPAGGVLLRSDNPAFEPRVLALDQLRELWRVELKLTASFDDIVALHARKIETLQAELAELRDQVSAVLQSRDPHGEP